MLTRLASSLLECSDGKKGSSWRATTLGTAPYMHDGSLITLEEVVEFYDQGGIPNRRLDEKLVKLNLTSVDKQDLTGS
jgi:cytochrome c peroxidase